MPVSFSFYIDPLDAKNTVRQLLVREVLVDSKSVKKDFDITCGQTAKAAEGGIQSLKKPSTNEMNVVFVVDSGFYPIDMNAHGFYVEYLLNGKYYRLVTGYCPSGARPRDNYPPLWIRPIKLPAALNAMVSREVPAPINDVPGPTPPPQPHEITADSVYIDRNVPVSEQEDPYPYNVG